MTIDASLNERLRRVQRKHDKMRTHGVVHKVGRDGLIRTRPRLIRREFPLRGLLLTVGLLIVFKAMLFAHMGAGNYRAQIAELERGSGLEQVGAFLMQEDPATAALGGYLKGFFFAR